MKKAFFRGELFYLGEGVEDLAAGEQVDPLGPDEPVSQPGKGHSTQVPVT